jgi:hypothetical protein
MQYVYALGVIGIATIVIWKSAVLGRVIPIRWAEEHLTGAGQAGSTTMYRLVGLLLILASFLWMTGILQSLIVSVFAPQR